MWKTTNCKLIKVLTEQLTCSRINAHSTAVSCPIYLPKPWVPRGEWVGYVDVIIKYVIYIHIYIYRIILLWAVFEKFIWNTERVHWVVDSIIYLKINNFINRNETPQCTTLVHCQYDYEKQHILWWKSIVRMFF